MDGKTEHTVVAWAWDAVERHDWQHGPHAQLTERLLQLHGWKRQVVQPGSPATVESTSMSTLVGTSWLLRRVWRALDALHFFADR